MDELEEIQDQVSNARTELDDLDGDIFAATDGPQRL